jgi:hypothetical protein
VSHVLGLVSWNPEIRNILSLGVGIAVLMGSVVLLISTNTGPRTGGLIVLAGLFGWLTIMGMLWWLYTGSPASLGGMKGTPPHWRVLDVNVGNLQADPLPQAQKLPDKNELQTVQAILAKHPELEAKVNPEHKPGFTPTIGELIEADPDVATEFGLTPAALNGWHLLVPSDKQRGDAQSTADTALGPDGQKIFKDTSNYKVIEAYDIGGKENEHPLPPHATWIDRIKQNVETALEFSSPEHYAIVQVQAVVPQETLPGQAPPTPKLDPNAPVVSVVMIRSLGDVRFPGFMLFVCAGTLFAVTCNTLHRRDKRIARTRATAS